MKSAHSDVAFSVPVPSITERKRENSDAVLELSEAQGLVSHFESYLHKT